MTQTDCAAVQKPKMSVLPTLCIWKDRTGVVTSVNDN